MSTVTITVTNSDERQDLKSVLKTTKAVLVMVLRYKESRKYAFFSILSRIVDIVYSFAMIILPGLLINELTCDKRSEVIIFCVCNITFGALLSSLLKRFITVKNTAFKLHISSVLVKEYDIKSAMLDYEELEKPETQAESSRVCGTISVALNIIDDLCNIGSSILIFIGSAAIFTTINPLLLIVLFVVIVINFLVTKAVNKKLHKNEKRKSQKSLLQSFLMLVLHLTDYAKEVRLFDTKRFFANKLYDNRREINEITVSNARINANASIAFHLTASCQTFIMYGYFIYQILHGKLLVGSMMIYINTIEKFSASLSGIVNGYLNLARNSLDNQEMIRYMKKVPGQYQVGTRIPIIKSDSMFEFRNVSFKYNGAERCSVENLNFKLRINERLCIVGENGAGKSTFVKLLLRLYFPSEGEILLDGVNINEFDYEYYLKIFSPVFQDYQLYPISLKENIVFDEECDMEKLGQCMKQSGLTNLASKLSHGADTSIYKWIEPDGFEPSGGEAQKIAIARALYNGGEIYILDEPTAALDPNAEYEIYTKFHDMVAGKTAIFITHRLSAVQLADKVAVFKNGHVAEYGTHAELYEKGGIYTEMFDKQARFYRDTN